MNETEQVFVFETIFNNKSYAIPIIINMALPVELQDHTLLSAIAMLTNMTRKDAAGAVEVAPGECSCKSCKGECGK